MADSTIGITEPASPNKKLQSYQNVVSSQTVEAEAVVQVATDGTPALIDTGAGGIPVVLPQGSSLLYFPQGFNGELLVAGGQNVPLEQLAAGTVRVDIKSSSTNVTTVPGFVNVGSSQPTVGTTAVVIVSSVSRGLAIKNIGTTNIYLGSSSVTTANGYYLAPGESVSLAFGSNIYAISDAAGGKVSVLLG